MSAPWWHPESNPMADVRAFRDAYEVASGYVREHAADCDLSTTCLVCGAPMRQEHAHMRCPACGWVDHCCEGR